MNQTNWLTERLISEHQRDLMQAAEKARQAQDVKKTHPSNKPYRLLEKLRAELINSNYHTESDSEISR